VCACVRARCHVIEDTAGPSPTASGPAHAFAVIDEVTDGSPAALDGIRVGDMLLRFGAHQRCTDEADLRPEARSRMGSQRQTLQRTAINSPRRLWLSASEERAPE
jgi:S1-C subfamily serine protease